MRNGRAAGGCGLGSLPIPSVFSWIFAIVALATSAGAADTPRFLRGVNLNGPAVTIDDHRWEGADSKNYRCRDKAFESSNVPLVPSTDAERAKMIRSSRWGGNRVELLNLPNGPLTVFLYVWEDNNSETFTVSLDGRPVASGFKSGSAGQWHRLGPWHTEATGSKLILTSEGGAANFSGVELWRGTHDGSNEPPMTEEQLAFFENRIRPLLATHCYECHSAESDELQGGLLVDSRPTLRKGGDSGPAVVPGNAHESLLLKAVRHEDGLDMPPASKLSDQEIADLEQWITSGAPDPRSDATRYVRKKIDVATARQFWSLKPIADPPVPAVKQANWPKTEIDRFLLAELERKNLQPVADADKRTLIRRVTYDLTGLPPTPVEIAAFVADSSPEAFANVVDRLLDSPRYGERWGRHWMDLVRYADTSGCNSDYPVPQAYLYRNYIIDSFNADKPYDRFLEEQIAGDLMPAEGDARRNEQTIATGYLAISRRFGSLVKNYPQHLTIEDSLDNIGRTVLGMSLTCARCHDHKFDPISQEDYYGLYGILNSTRYPFPGIELEKKPRDFVPLLKNGKPSDELAYAMAEAKPADAALQSKGDPEKPADIIPRKFPEVLGGFLLDNPKHSGRLELAHWLTDPQNPLTARVMVNRIWQHHFGVGLVATPSDFGTRGLPPTHPELLDWLASRFIADGWSIKAMHRRILLSRAYQLSSQSDGETRAVAIDPGNSLHWRFNRQRLDAEQIRDTLLALGGDLDLEMPREPHPFPPVEKWAFTQHHPFRDSYDSNKRSVYLMAARLNARPFFTTFDGADRNASTATRDSSVTTVQSLYLLNDEFVQEQAAKFAARLLAMSNTDDRLTTAFELTLGRPPSAEDRQGTRDWLTQLATELPATGSKGEKLDRDAWAALARVLLRTNEFLHVD